MIPAMGFDYVPGDMIASLTAEGMGEVDEVLLAYSTSRASRTTRGTELSALEMLDGRRRRVAQAPVDARGPERRAWQLRLPASRSGASA